MGNGHAPGTAIGLGATGVETTATGFGAGRCWEAGLAVFFFAAFFIAGFLAGFFLAGFLAAADFRAAAGFFALAADFRLTAGLRTAFFAGLRLRATLVFTVFFFAAFFLLAIRTSVCWVQFTGSCSLLLMQRRIALNRKIAVQHVGIEVHAAFPHHGT